jgi:hypothetical protein
MQKGPHLAKVSILDNGLSRRGWSDVQRTAIVEERNRILAHPTFKGSRRCMELLSYLVDSALTGEEDGIKERTLGIEVFGRDPNYDTNSDPIVRRTANEIRKRLGQCYFEPYGRPGVRIHMARGSYLLEFEFEGDDVHRDPTETDSYPTEAENPEEAPEPSEQQEPGSAHFEVASTSTSRLLRRGLILGIAIALLVSLAYFISVRFDAFRSPEYKLWEPLLASGDRITVCVSDVTTLAGLSGTTDSSIPSASPLSHGTPQKTPFLDTRVAQALSIKLLEFKRQTNLQPSSALTFQSFREGPVVLVGGTINPWGSVLLSKLRYTLQIDPITLDKWIQDAQNPSARNWKINGKLQSSDTFDDYAVVTRFFDKDTGQWILALSGLEAHGTEAAGELVADPAFAKLIPSSVHSTGNFQIVLKTEVMRGSTGPFEVIAVHTW